MTKKQNPQTKEYELFDIFDRRLFLGDYIATTSGAKSGAGKLRLGKVIRITENGNLFIKAIRYNRIVSMTLQTAEFLILNYVDVPPKYLELFSGEK